MGGFLPVLGSLAGGVSQGLGPYLQQALQQQQQNQTDYAVGQGLYGLAGQPLPQGSTPPPTGFGALFGLGGGSGPNVPVQSPNMAQNVPVQPPQLGQGGVAQSPMSAPSPIPQGAPRNPSAGQVPLGGQQQGLPQPPAYSPISTAPLSTVSPALQQQQAQQPKLPDLSMHNGMYDFPTLLHHLAGQPGMDPIKLSRIANSKVFENMMNQQGLLQYKLLNLGIAVDKENLAHDKFALDAEKLKDTQERLANNEAIRTQQTTLGRKLQEIERQYTQQSSRLIFLPADQQKAAAEKLDNDYNNATDAINRQMDALDRQTQPLTGGGESSSEGGGGENDVIHDPKTGQMRRYKGSGDRGNLDNYEPMQ